jgi:hypothetical protein
MKTLFLILFASSIIFAQPASSGNLYEIPFASKGNEIELEIANDSELNIRTIAVTQIEKPNWISFSNDQNIINELKPNQSGKVVFNFDVEKEAEVLEEQILKFQISGNNQTWEKEIRITVLSPDRFELNQNYPNPFNPTTTISYLIPKNEKHETSNVNLIIYDILGREVETLVNNEQKPGFYKLEWNANNYASGMYIYQLSMKNDNKTELLRKKLMLMK